MQIVTSWMRKGIRQGQRQGRLDVLERQLESRMGELPPGLEARLRRLSTGRLDELAEAIFDSQSPADLEAWLKRKP